MISFNEPTAIVICGPTGSGKSELAISLAKRLDSEIISADSISIYKNLNIGTAKPTKEEMNEVKHHMIDVCESNESFTVSDYELMATPIIKKLFASRKVPIICGGTGFYIKSLLFDFSYGNCSKNEEIRNKYQRYFDENGGEALHSLLEKVDPETAQKLHFNDYVRVIRALEIFEQSGVKKSEIKDEVKPKFNYFAFSYDFERSELYERINRRVDKMFSLGLVDEVKNLISSGLSMENQSMQGIGYKEFFNHGEIDANIEEIKEEIKLNSRRYAKRQITFFKKLDGLQYIEFDNAEKSCNNIMEMIDNEII